MLDAAPPLKLRPHEGWRPSRPPRASSNDRRLPNHPFKIDIVVGEGGLPLSELTQAPPASSEPP